MTTLYSQSTCDPVGEFSECTCKLAQDWFPDRYFYYIGEPDIIDVSQFDADFLKVGGTI